MSLKYLISLKLKFQTVINKNRTNQFLILLRYNIKNYMVQLILTYIRSSDFGLNYEFYSLAVIYFCVLHKLKQN